MDEDDTQFKEWEISLFCCDKTPSLKGIIMHEPKKIPPAYVENGYLHLKSFISQAERERLIMRMRDLTERKCHNDPQRIFQAARENRQSMDNFFLQSAHKISFFFDKNLEQQDHQQPNFQKLNKVGHALHNLCPVFGKFSHQSKFYDLVKDLGQEKPLLVQSMFIFKQPRFGDEVPPHQDATFIYTEPNSLIGLWFALEDASVDNGCLWVLPGGHRGPLKNRFQRMKEGFSFNCEQRVSWPKTCYQPLEAKAGDVIVLHGMLPHFSERNRSKKTRFAYTLHFIDRRCHYEKNNWLDISQN